VADLAATGPGSWTASKLCLARPKQTQKIWATRTAKPKVMPRSALPFGDCCGQECPRADAGTGMSPSLPGLLQLLKEHFGAAAALVLFLPAGRRQVVGATLGKAALLWTTSRITGPTLLRLALIR
jgi:hypothetical protein